MKTSMACAHRNRCIVGYLALVMLALSGCTDTGSGRYPAVVVDAAQKQFLVDNGKRAGVISTASGLQYEALRTGSGPMPTANDAVTVNYVGTLIDGTEFDSSYSRNQPSTFPLSGVILGWIEGVQLMNVGSLYRFVIPAALAYGERGAGSKIKPGDTLIFSIELLAIN